MKHPRTMNEAFTKTAEYGASIQKFKHTPQLIDICIWIIASSALVVVLFDVFFWRP